MPLKRPDASSIARFGLGLAAVGRPGYITLGRDLDLPADRSVEAMQAHVHRLLDAAYTAGVRYFDAARSYGMAEDFLASWLHARPDVQGVVIGSKWGYTYTAGWRTDARTHEVKDHSLATFRRQLSHTRALLGTRLDLYQVHSVTPTSTALTDPALHERLAVLATEGVTIGLSASGPDQAETIRTALEITVEGKQLFGSVQATYNLMEPSAGAALAEAHAAGCTVIVKEGLANGRLADRHASGPEATVLRDIAQEAKVSCDAVALAAVAAQPWADIVLSGAATAEQLISNLTATHLRLVPDQLERLTALAEPADVYWAQRSQLSWT
ncbi:aldo/keto reductase [Acrocarpospora catenulata]|uniref:aldo/keto reductase n=1 Tax=Acrocarpospora catenulata TaxID=2836182 RepID=UPI002023932D|nr:aldo/keto reductase [Acrocarpospora catenulata]